MGHRFNTIGNAIQAGYDTATARNVETYRGFEIVISDTSGGSYFGYSFGVKALPSMDLIRAGHDILGPFGSTVTVSFDQEPNKLGKPGSAMAMFPPSELSRAIAEAKTRIDEVL